MEKNLVNEIKIKKRNEIKKSDLLLLITIKYQLKNKMGNSRHFEAAEMLKKHEQFIRPKCMTIDCSINKQGR